LHFAVAINNGVTKAEVVEVILQAALYCGAPAALDAMRIAKEVISELEQSREVE
jgi:4-carboxymuconolactone decarboxylase